MTERFLVVFLFIASLLTLAIAIPAVLSTDYSYNTSNQED